MLLTERRRRGVADSNPNAQTQHKLERFTVKRRLLLNGKTAGVAVGVLALAIVVMFLKSQSGQTEQAANAGSNVSHSQVSVDLSSSQLNSIKVEPLGTTLDSSIGN